ncbi:S1 family peptidase [Actinosynnema sp. NPDC050436]|uniref:S1 family peptidase n=1 Tax=Actinosynnema sp. NPDC050436 TaxID=3155659 RepID=UPI0033FD9091
MRTLLPASLTLLALLTPTPPATATPATPTTSTTTTAPIPLEAGTPLTSPPNARCVNGFNVQGHLLVSVRCATHTNPVTGPGGGRIGPVLRIRDTYAVVKVLDPASWDQLPRLAGYATPITGSAEAAIGATVCAGTRSTGWRCGTVQAKNQTVNHGTGAITGLTRTNLCVHSGDDWVPVVSGNQAQGHLLGGSGSGSGNCTSFFYPINRILKAEQFTLTTAHPL